MSSNSKQVIILHASFHFQVKAPQLAHVPHEHAPNN